MCFNKAHKKQISNSTYRKVCEVYNTTFKEVYGEVVLRKALLVFYVSCHNLVDMIYYFLCSGVFSVHNCQCISEL